MAPDTHLQHIAAPAGLPDMSAGGFSQVVVGSGRLVVISGQVAIDERGEVVGRGDLPAQARQAYENVGRCLASAGATFADVVKFTNYLTDISWLPSVREVRNELIDAERAPASTGVQVAALASPDFLIEVEAWAILPEG